MRTITNCGGTVLFYDSYGFLPYWIRSARGVDLPKDGNCDLSRLCDLRELEDVYGDGSGASDEELRWLGGVKRLKVVRLSDTSTRGEWIKGVRQGTPLKDLSLNNTMVDDEIISQLTRFDLVHLELAGTKVTDASMGRIASMAVRILDLRRTRISDAAVGSLRNLKHVDVLYLSSPPISRAAADRLGAELGLKVITTHDGSFSFSDTSMRNIVLQLEEPPEDPVGAVGR